MMLLELQTTSSVANMVLVYADMGVGNNPSQFSYGFMKSEYKKQYRQRCKMGREISATGFHEWNSLYNIMDRGRIVCIFRH